MEEEKPKKNRQGVIVAVVSVAVFIGLCTWGYATRSYASDSSAWMFFIFLTSGVLSAFAMGIPNSAKGVTGGYAFVALGIAIWIALPPKKPEYVSDYKGPTFTTTCSEWNVYSYSSQRDFARRQAVSQKISNGRYPSPNEINDETNALIVNQLLSCVNAAYKPPCQAPFLLGDVVKSCAEAVTK